MAIAVAGRYRVVSGWRSISNAPVGVVGNAVTRSVTALER